MATITEIRAARAAELSALVARTDWLTMEAAQAADTFGCRFHFADFGPVRVVLEVDWTAGEPQVGDVWLNGKKLDAEDHFSATQINLWQAELTASALEAA